MSGALFYLPNARQLSISGAILPGFKLKFFVSETLTPAAVYADADLVTPLGTTVVADTDGHLEAIYLDENVLYRVQVTDANDVLQPDGDVDPLNRLPSGAVSSVVAGDGITVDNTDPQNPIVSATAFNPLTDFIVTWIVLAGTTNITWNFDGGVSTNNEGTTSSGTVAFNASRLQSVVRVEATSSALANDPAAWRQTSIPHGVVRRTSGNAFGGGFDLTLVAGFPTARADQCAFIGLFGNNTTGFNAGANPGSYTGKSMIGIGKDQADTNLQLFVNDNAGAPTKIDLGISFASLADKLLRLRLTADNGGSDMQYSVYNYETNTVIVPESTVAANLPAADDKMWWITYANTGAATTTPVTVAFARATLITAIGINC